MFLDFLESLLSFSDYGTDTLTYGREWDLNNSGSSSNNDSNSNSSNE